MECKDALQLNWFFPGIQSAATQVLVLINDVMRARRNRNNNSFLKS